MRTKFTVRETADGGGRIYLSFSYGTKKRFRYSTKLKVKKIKNWDYGVPGKVRNVVEETNRLNINDKLNKLRTHIESYYNNLHTGKGVSINDEMLKNECDIFFGRKELEKEEPVLKLIPFYKWFVDNYTKRPLMSTGKVLKQGTAKTYKNSMRILERFAREEYSVNYETIGISFYNDFLEWCEEQEYKPNYIGTQIKVLKTMLNASLELGNHNNIEHTKKYFRKPSGEAYNIYLNIDELERLHNVNLSNIKPIKISKSLYLTSKKLSEARDLFLIMANTGLRVSDIDQVIEKNILDKDKKKYLKVRTTKNNKPIFIPLKKVVLDILNKYGYVIPKMPSQHINYAIKEVGRIAEINEIENYEVKLGGIAKQVSVPRYELIKNHTGRRSFCSNAFLSGVPVNDIMHITSHSTEKVFYNYIKASPFDRVVKASQSNFFN